MNRTIRLKNFFLYIFTFWYGTEIIFNSTLFDMQSGVYDRINIIATWLVFGLLMMQIVFFQSYTRRELMVIVSVTLPMVAATVLSGQRTILSAWMFIVAAKNIDLDSVIQRAYKILLILTPTIMILCVLGVIENKMLLRGNIPRYALGFLHPNQLGLRVFQLIVCHCYVHKGALRKHNYFYILFSIFFLVRIPNSKTAYIVTIFFLVLLLLYRYIEGRKAELIGLYEKGIFYGALCFNLFSIILSYIDVNKNFVLAKIDDWMSSRFSFCHIVWGLYKVTVFGQRIYVTEEERSLAGIRSRLWLDNAYVSALLRYGILVFLIFSIGYLCLIRAALLQKQYMLAIILFLYALYGVMENGLYMITHNIFLITFSTLLYKKSIQEDRRMECSDENR